MSSQAVLRTLIPMKLRNSFTRCLATWRNGSTLSVLAAAGLVALANTADAAKVVWQQDSDSPAGQEFIELLEAAGHEVTLLNTGTPSDEDIEMINEHDVVVFSRKNSSGNFEGDANQFWDTDITIPAIAMSAYIVRDNRLQWVQGNDVPDDTPAEVNVDTGHPVWVCVEPGPWHTEVDRGTTFNANALVEPGVLIASAAGADDTTEAIVAEWPADTIAAGPRMLFNAGARELDGADIADAGAYNLTPEGEQAFRNAVAYMAFLSGNVSKPSGSSVYLQDFTADDGTTDLGDGSTLTSTPAVIEVEANALVMTRDGTASTLSGYVLPALPDLSGGFVASFDFALSGGGDRPADGFSFNFGDLGENATGNGEEGFTGATNDLRVEFDTWDNDATEPEGFNGIGFDVETGADNLARCRIPLDSMAWTNNAAFRFTGEFRPVWIKWQDGLLDLVIDGVPIFTGVDTGAWVPNGNIGFTARTGGATETLILDNVEIASTGEVATIASVSEFGLADDTPAVINTDGFAEGALAYSDRTHVHQAAQFGEDGILAVDGATVVPLPDYLLGGQYVQFANDAREQTDYFATVTASQPTSWYLLIDNRLNGTAGDTSSPNSTDPDLAGTLQWVLDDGWERVNTGISPDGQADYTAIDESADGGLNQFFSVYTLPNPNNSVTVRSNGIGGSNMISLIAAQRFDGELGELGTVLLDFGSSGPNANGSATGWAVVNNLVQDEPLSIAPGVTITALEDGFNPNNTDAPGAGASFDGIDVPQNVFDDYLFKIADTPDTSAVMRIDGLPASTYSVTVFEGRTSDAAQFGKIWVGEEPADENTGDFAGGDATVLVEVGPGDSLFYRHLEDGSGGISGMIIQPMDVESPNQVGVAVSTFTGGDSGEGLDLEGNFLYAINMLGAGDLAVREATFTMDDVAGFTFDQPNAAPDWHAPEYGDTTNDDNLEAIMKDIRWNAGPVNMSLGGLTPGQTYKLQLLFAEAGWDRGWDILFDGIPSVENFNVQRAQGGFIPSVGVVVTYSFIPQIEEMTIQFQQSNPPFPDNNPILQGLTLETVVDTDGDGLDDDLEMAAFGDLDQTPDGDLDTDGLSNFAEIIGGTDPTMDADTDGDGLTDAEEILVHGTDPNNADSDGDGLSDGDEANTHNTNPLVADTDLDGLTDGDEVNTHNTDPLVADSDGDGFWDGLEVILGSHPNSPSLQPPFLAFFTGGDLGEGLDLDGDFLYAINMRGPGDLQVRDALFTDDSVEGFTFDQPNEILNWHAPDYGGTTNDDNLEVVMQSIRWNGGPVAMSLAGLTPGETYKLQLLFAEQCCNRGWDISVEGEIILDDFNVQLLQAGAGNTARGAAVVYEFTATDDTLEIDFINDAPVFPDNNPILNGLTLEVNSEPTLRDVTSPSDPIVVVDGENDGDENDGPPPAAEGVENAINDVSQKYLHFLDLNSGLIVSPSLGASVVTRLRVYTANDAVERDPASYQLSGSTSGPEGPFTLIASGDLALPEDRNGTGDEPINVERFHQEIVFENAEAYTDYRLIFPTLKDAAAANSMQIAEIELIGYGVPGIPGNLLVNGSFEEPVLNNINTNNLGVVPTGWSQTGEDATWNMIRNDGSPYGSGVDRAAQGFQIVDLNGVFALFQNFTLTEASSLSFGASFANREGHDGSDPSTVGIYDAAGTELLSPLVTVDTSEDPTPSEVWRSGEATVADLPAGEYQLRIALNNFNNVDAVFVKASTTAPPTDGDSDGDGVSDEAEAIAGTDPNDPTSYLRVTDTAFDGLSPVIQWTAVEGKTYDVEYSSDLQTWIMINEAPVSAVDGMATFTDMDPTRNVEPMGYYRAVVIE